MAECKRIVVSLPGSLLEEVDNMICNGQCDRNEFVSKAMEYYISEVKKVNFVESMKKGYLEMTQINVMLAEIGLTADQECICNYETRLAERE